MTTLSAYRIMWVLVMFDLPVGTSDERKLAHDFRLALLDLGFGMTQYSVYMRFCVGISAVETCMNRVEAALPPGGKVNLLTVTDKQYERIVSFIGRERQPGNVTPSQFALF